MLYLKFYVYGVDTGYAYGQFGYPYDYVQEAEYQFNDAMEYFYDYEEFQYTVQFAIIDIIAKTAYRKADFIAKAEEELHIWTTSNTSHLF